MKNIFAFLFLTAASHLIAQDIVKDTLLPPVTKTHYKYIGIQANLLLQQFISFNSNSSINTNPYLFLYTKNNIKTGKGFVFATGFNVSETSSNDGVSSITVQNANFAFRLGSERKYLQQERFIPFWGVDLGFGGLYNNVTSELNQTFGSTRTTVQTSKAFLAPCSGAV